MTERERLIELIRRGMNKHEVTIENYVIPTSDYLADYLLENGVIVPPCKVGDTVVLEKPVVMPEKQWSEIMMARKEIVEVLERHNVPDGFKCKILIDIERSIDKGMMRTIMEAKNG